MQIDLPLKQWENIFLIARKSVKDTRVLDIQYKILHRCYASNSTIAKWDASVSPLCKYCNQKSNILHDFYQCQNLKPFWREVQTFASTNFGLNIKISCAEDVIFRNYKDLKKEFANHIILYAKYFIHIRKIKEELVHMEQFIYYYNNILEQERERYIMANRLYNYTQKFKGTPKT